MYLFSYIFIGPPRGPGRLLAASAPTAPSTAGGGERGGEGGRERGRGRGGGRGSGRPLFFFRTRARARCLYSAASGPGPRGEAAPA